MEEDVQKILNLAVYAPSGHNSQPWKFKLKRNNNLLVYNDPDADQTLYNYKQRGSYIALGALVETIKIAASKENYHVTFSFFPERTDTNLVVSCIFESSSKEEDSLYPAIKKRSTNRKSYKKRNVDQVILKKLKSLENTVQSEKEINIFFVEDEKKKKNIAKALSINDWLLFNNYAVHQALFPYIIWNKEEEKEKRSGLYIDTFELPVPIKMLFRLFAYWNFAKILGKIGWGSVVAKQNSNLYASTGALGIITISDTSPLSFVSAGRVFQRLWLSAVVYNLHIQPVVGVLYLNQRIEEEDSSLPFSITEKLKIQNAISKIKVISGVGNGILVMLFRIGYGKAASATSSRKKPNIYFDK